MNGVVERWLLCEADAAFHQPVKLAQHILVLVLRLYRRLVSPVLASAFGPMGLGCRFAPTCSEYALEAVRVHGALRGSWLAACRLGRCHPWGGEGFDPVPRANALGSGSGAARCRDAARHEHHRPAPSEKGLAPVARPHPPRSSAGGMRPFVSRSNGS